jgi:hypothetical protein
MPEAGGNCLPSQPVGSGNALIDDVNTGHQTKTDTVERITGLKRSTGIVSLVGAHRF